MSENSNMQEHQSRILPWIILLIAALALLFFVNRGCAGQKTHDDPAPTLGEAPAIKENAGAKQSRALRSRPDGVVGEFADMAVSGDINPSKAFILDSVGFVGRTSELTPGSKAQLNDLGDVMNQLTDITVRIEAHTDNSGTAKDNVDLSLQRAIAVKDFLLNKYVATERIALAGRGQYKPIATNNTDAGRARNNRVEVYFDQMD